MEAKDIKISFTLEQVNALLTRLGSLPYAQVADLVQGIQAIAAPQVPKEEAAPEQGSEPTMQ